MGTTFEAFCCSNENREITQGNINNKDSLNKSSDLPIKSSIFGNNGLNQMMDKLNI